MAWGLIGAVVAAILARVICDILTTRAKLRQARKNLDDKQPWLFTEDDLRQKPRT